MSDASGQSVPLEVRRRKPMTTLQDDKKTLAALAAALIEQPRATLQELAEAIGVSKATLYRFCGTREDLIGRLLTHGCDSLNQALLDADLATGSARDGLRRLIDGQLAHKELLAFLTYYWQPESLNEQIQAKSWHEYEVGVDQFFLKGQREGAFRIDISAQAMNEALTWLIVGLVDGARRGRIARANLAQMVESLFLDGAK